MIRQDADEQIIKGKRLFNDKLDFIKILSSVFQKKKIPRSGRKHLQNIAYNGVYPEYIKNSYGYNEIINYPSENKWAKNLTRHFTKEGNVMTDMHINRCSTL